MSLSIHAVVQGPHNRYDLDPDDMVMICVAQHNEVVYYDFELYSNDFDWLYSIERHTKTSLEPFLIPEYEG